MLPKSPEAKVALLVPVFAKLAKEVGLLEHEAHRFGEDKLVGDPRSFFFGGGE
jgi:hypothetical protein